MSLTFSDGMTFNTSGPLRLAKRSDGWYVLGEGMLLPVEGPTEGRIIIDSIIERRKKG
jgi:hypothetical protein